ncbi:MAG: hypothetical protein R3B96_18835 [Pirellulaceae bacterium]
MIAGLASIAVKVGLLTEAETNRWPSWAWIVFWLAGELLLLLFLQANLWLHRMRGQVLVVLALGGAWGILAGWLGQQMEVGWSAAYESGFQVPRWVQTLPGGELWMFGALGAVVTMCGNPSSRLSTHQIGPRHGMA